MLYIFIRRWKNRTFIEQGEIPLHKVLIQIIQSQLKAIKKGNIFFPANDIGT